MRNRVVVSGGDSPRVVTTGEDTSRVVLAGAAQGPAGPQGAVGPGGSETLTRTAGEALGGERVVALNADDEAVYASSADATALRVVGFTTAAVSSGADTTVRQFGVLSWPAANLTPDAPVYLTTNGQVSHTPPASGYIRQVGIALAADKLQVAIGPVFVGAA
jgi:hypothetical protein